MDTPNDLSYPWIGPDGALQLSATTDRGSTILREFIEPLAAFARDTGTPLAIRQVRRSYGDLDRIALDVTRLRGTDVANGDLLVMTVPDWKNARVIIGLTAMDDRLMQLIADNFGTEAIAVYVDPALVPGQAQDTRQADWSVFSGGARIDTPLGFCSDAFGWVNGALWDGMLTAGHCVMDGGNVSTPVQTMGSVAAGSRENWDRNSGSVPYTGSSIVRGDVALIQNFTGRDSQPRMFRGGVNSGVTSIVRLVWQRWSMPGDDYCFSGVSSGELCGFEVHHVGMQYFYINIPGGWVRNVVGGGKSGACPTGGDSGGAIFTIYGDGAAAKGVHSGIIPGVNACTELFTDIQHPIQALPGGVSSLP